MRRLALVTLVTMLALPGAALARPRAFSARVVRAGTHTLAVRLASGKLVYYSSVRVAPRAPERPLLAHVARAMALAGAAFELRALEPGVTILVSATKAGVSVALPGPGAPEQQATGVVRDVQPDGFVLQLGDQTRLRLHASGAIRLRGCARLSVAYHQDVALLVADRVTRAGGVRARGCVERSATGTITAVSASSLTIATAAGRSLTFAVSGATADGFAVGDAVDVSYVRGRAIEVAYVERLARGTVTRAGGGAVTVLDGATGRALQFATSAGAAVGEHVVVVYHRSLSLAVADAVYGTGIA
jgi:hypothetical protein